MFFLVRCIFWLSLVFANLSDSPAARGANAGAFLDLARGRIEAFTGHSVAAKAVAASGVSDLATAAAEQGAAWCKANGEACVDAILSTMLAKGGGSADTLTMVDRSLRRRG